MGNQQSQQQKDPFPKVAMFTLSSKAKRRLSHSPGFQSYLEQPTKKTNYAPSFMSIARHHNLLSSSSRKNSDASGGSTVSSRPSAKTHKTDDSSDTVSGVLTSHTVATTTLQNHDYVMIGGRRYIAPHVSHYFLPCDDDEADRQIVLHFLLKYTFHGNFTAPVTGLFSNTADNHRPQVLDIGCGPGTWILEMASEFSGVDFHGVDITRMFPVDIKPSNAFFKQADILEGLPYEDNTFEFVNMRLMLACLTKEHLIFLLAEVSRVLKPGGYFEIVDVEYNIQRPGPLADKVVNQKLQKIMASHKIDLRLSHQLSTLMMSQGAGLVDIRHSRHSLPLGWGGQTGDLHAQNMEQFLRSLNPIVRRHSDGTVITDDDIKQVMAECTKYQSHLNWYVCYARKPCSSTVAPLTPPPCIEDLPGKAHNGVEKPNSTPHLAGETWESIQDFIDGYVD
ncbi:S-adenosyl-L-methionine-dependent methyltransferase [Radiomyces spectabilis]|uniref:S-adenosyl-L-methionine-dependent methyltransferase n=1 Tax=Radiomyces spectabilis TaxID=64574 RepID=UPI00221FFC6D|nr:S-adenosyl-L-methionine-dependent methyltransferase [Radiomyces spectabilis]KAI8364737.1 S-adenosyl-L-methionine-dependent methyltransferase [Radiomyces spectabilis]